MSYILIFTLVIFSLSIILLFWILVSPIKITINTFQNTYKLTWLGIGIIYYRWLDQTPIVVIKSLKWTKRIDLLNISNKAKGESNEKSSSHKKKSSFLTWKKIRSIITSFEVKKFNLIVDTEDFLLNAYLYPIFTLLSRKNQTLQVNYKDYNQLHCVIENRLYRIITRLFIS